MSVIDAGQTRSLTKTWMTLLESFPTWRAEADPFWIFVWGLLAFKPLLVLGICFELRFGSLLGCHLLGISAQRAFSRDLLLASSLRAVIIEDLTLAIILSPRGLRRLFPFH